MSTHRPPLANVPNATNSPHRAMIVPSKRSRYASNQVEIPYGQPPPKKQAVEGTDRESHSPTRARPSSYNAADSKLFSRRTNAQPSAFEKKLVAARDKEKHSQVRTSRHEKQSTETLDNIRQWQRHYRKAFPQFVFYFDSIPEDVRGKFSRQVIALGAREEKFFSRLVTHVVTSRPIPAENATGSFDVTTDPSDQPTADAPHTVNPSVLEKNADGHIVSLKGDARREQSNMDVLHRARKMGMKIWALEKLQRMISTINDGELGGSGHSARGHAGGNAKTKGDNDLSQVLRNELVNGPSDRDPFSSIKEMIMFKGPFIYIHDMDEKTRPVMVREYPKVARRQDGAWPQFRSAPLGKCPFIEETPQREAHRHRSHRGNKEKKAVPKPTAQYVTRDEEPVKQAVYDAGETVKEEHGFEAQQAPLDQPKTQKVPIKQESPKKSSEHFIPPQMPRTGPFYLGREPAASGMISSTATAPGAKAAVSKEVHELKRKVLEKGGGGMPPAVPHDRPADPPLGLKMMKDPGRTEGTDPKGKHGHANEDDTTQSEDTGYRKRRLGSRKTSVQKEERRRDPKPGYCENCREKFDDFEEHTHTRKHRKFAMTESNWTELDALLSQLERPRKNPDPGEDEPLRSFSPNSLSEWDDH
ncbi:G1 S regulator [Aspergillus sclerotialis]|uniref:G1 S regulator n=1 Tax=Aspergillus sclerotialis TaxID=2070753 RepID=A0A3A3A2J9_9EURO|nr:G1 S regulator [Aspergillus sclerotialis]